MVTACLPEKNEYGHFKLMEVGAIARWRYENDLD
jgi:hypothetical protein